MSPALRALIKLAHNTTDPLTRILLGKWIDEWVCEIGQGYRIAGYVYERYKADVEEIAEHYKKKVGYELGSIAMREGAIATPASDPYARGEDFRIFVLRSKKARAS